jgi:hypothetical protein
MNSKKLVGLFVILAFILAEMVFAVDSKKAMYVGGTVSSIKEKAEGIISIADEKQFQFTTKSSTLLVPYDRVNSMEYGQKAGRRVGVAILVSPIALLSKKRKHYLTLNFMDDQDKQQAVVLDIVRVTLSSLEARTGRKIEYQDEEARKSAKGD